jgi:hypothetical protein
MKLRRPVAGPALALVMDASQSEREVVLLQF